MKKVIRANKIKNISKTILRACLLGSFVVLLFIFVIILICWGDSFYNSSKGIVKSPLLGAYVVVTESMVPTINVNDAIVVKRANAKTLKVGDIITFSSNDIYYNGWTITHRIVEKSDDNGNVVYRTKGDNNDLVDSAAVDFDNIYGKVILRIPKIGYLHKFISTPFGFILSIIIPVLLVIIYEVWRILTAWNQRYKEVEIL